MLEDWTRSFSPNPDLSKGRVGKRSLLNPAGFTIIEVLMVVTIIGIITAIAVPQLSRAREMAMIARAIGDVDALGWDVMDYEVRNGGLPSSLAAIGRDGFLDPWGNAYQYLKIRGEGGGVGKARKDRFLVPINSDFDLYSMGPDGKSSSALTAKPSHDDIIRANDGGWVGVAEKY